jgi:hypothetical protein
VSLALAHARTPQHFCCSGEDPERGLSCGRLHSADEVAFFRQASTAARE